jgi:hypothetical protein
VVGAVLGLAGCGFGGGGGGSAVGRSPTITPVRTTTSTTLPAAVKLASKACQEYRVAVANPNTSIAYPDLFTADAEADSAGRLAGVFSNLAVALDTVKTQIQQIDQYQSGNSLNVNANAATLSQAQGQLRGDMVAVATLCQAEGI